MKESSEESDALAKTGAIASNQLLTDIRSLIASSRDQLAQTVNSELVLLYWNVGKRIRGEILGEERAEYGKQIVESLSKALTLEYGRGFSNKSLFHMIRFAEAFPDEEIVSALSRQLTN
jgi:DUF1016 N-terminal domain